VLDELVARQHGVLTRQQAFACGVTRAAIAAHLRAGRWQRLLGRVYAVFTGQPSRRSWLWAVALRAGRDAVLSHETAAELVGLRDEPAPVVHVTVPADRRVSRIPGAAVHLSARVGAARHPSRLPPQTRVEDTVLDLVDRAGSLDEALGWVTRAAGRRLTTAGRLRAAMARRTRLRWRAELSMALREVAAGCHSILELRYLRDVERAHGLPPAERQAVRRRRSGRWYDDVHYRGYWTRVELDGRVAHPVDARGRDRLRDNAAAVAGDTVLRYGWPDVTADPCACAVQVAAVLRQHGWTGQLRPCWPGCPAAAAAARPGPQRSRNAGR
jgi:hypothetical protein